MGQKCGATAAHFCAGRRQTLLAAGAVRETPGREQEAQSSGPSMCVAPRPDSGLAGQ
jgi:hypothetical protein